jgi:hypothetical protein
MAPRPAPVKKRRDSGATRDVHRAVFLNTFTLTPHSPNKLCTISDRVQSSSGRIEKPGITVYVFDRANRSKALNGLAVANAGRVSERQLTLLASR